MFQSNERCAHLPLRTELLTEQLRLPAEEREELLDFTLLLLLRPLRNEPVEEGRVLLPEEGRVLLPEVGRVLLPVETFVGRVLVLHLLLERVEPELPVVEEPRPGRYVPPEMVGFELPEKGRVEALGRLPLLSFPGRVPWLSCPGRVPWLSCEPFGFPWLLCEPACPGGGAGRPPRW